MGEVVTKLGWLCQNGELGKGLNQEQSLPGAPSKYLSKIFRKMTVISVKLQSLRKAAATSCEK